MFLPHQFVGQLLDKQIDQNIRRHFFRGMEFAEPIGDPGWFGPGSAVWHVHSHLEALIFGLQCAAYIERLDPSIYWMGDTPLTPGQTGIQERPDAPDRPNAAVRLGHSVAFFIGTAYGSTATAERLALAVRSMHHTIKASGPTGGRATTPTTPTGCAGTMRRWCGGASPPPTSCITHNRCEASRSTATTVSSCASGTHSAAPTCRPPSRRRCTA